MMLEQANPAQFERICPKAEGKLFPVGAAANGAETSDKIYTFLRSGIKFTCSPSRGADCGASQTVYANKAWKIWSKYAISVM
jgi:hypothetical protein